VASLNAEAPDLLKAGVDIPLPGNTYKVKPGDTFALIAAATSLSVWAVGQAAGPVTGLILPDIDIKLPPANTQVPWQAVRVLAEVAATVATGWEGWTGDTTFQPLYGTRDALLAEPEVEAAPNGLPNEVVRFRLHTGCRTRSCGSGCIPASMRSGTRRCEFTR
jgi:LysM repeat protein